MVFLVGPAPPVGGSVFYRRTVWLLPLVSSNVIVTCLVPSPPVGWGLWSFWLAPPRLCGAVCSTKICMVWLLPLVSSNVIVTCSLPFSPCKRCPCPCSDAVHSPSSPPSGLWVRSGCAGPLGGAGAVRGPGGRGWGPGRGDTMGGGGGVGARDPRAYDAYAPDPLLILQAPTWWFPKIVP